MKSLHYNHDDAFSALNRAPAEKHVAEGDDSGDRSKFKDSGIYEVVTGASMALGNYLMFSLGLMFLARYVIDQKQFGVYSASVAAITVAATAATLGMEKYLLKIVPSYRATRRINLVRGYRFFAPMVVTVVTLLVAAALYGLYRLSPPDSGLASPTFLFAICCLPAVVFVCYLLEVVTADGAFVVSTAFYRLVLPGLFVGGVFLLEYRYGQREVSATEAVVMWGLCWLVVLVMLYLYSRRVRPRNEQAGERAFRRLDWLRHSSAFLTYSLLMSLITNIGVLVLGLIPSARQDTAIYAAAAQLAGLIVVVSTATNRWYGPKLAACIALNDEASGQLFLRSRQIMMWVLVLGFMLFLWYGGEWALGLFGPKYTAGWTALVIMGFGASFNCLHSLAPMYLQYIGREWVVPFLLGGAVLLLIATSVPLGIFYGTVGVASAYTGTLVVSYLVFMVLARRTRRAMLTEQGASGLRTWL
ncbi:MAG: hypothetical protein VX641_06885 [Planctomycetota bacterium]|nr:hypothetical protein [Planctomycetota bacterium]